MPHLPDVNDLAVMWYPRKDVFMDATASSKINSTPRTPYPILLPSSLQVCDRNIGREAENLIKKTSAVETKILKPLEWFPL